jgi:hypothetical protein
VSPASPSPLHGQTRPKTRTSTRPVRRKAPDELEQARRTYRPDPNGPRRRRSVVPAIALAAAFPAAFVWATRSRAWTRYGLRQRAPRSTLDGRRVIASTRGGTTDSAQRCLRELTRPCPIPRSVAAARAACVPPVAARRVSRLTERAYASGRRYPMWSHRSHTPSVRLQISRPQFAHRRAGRPPGHGPRIGPTFPSPGGQIGQSGVASAGKRPRIPRWLQPVVCKTSTS